MDLRRLVPYDTKTPLGGGAYELEGADAFPHAPSDYQFDRYILQATYGKGEAEEAAARLIALCQDFGNWVALDYNVFRRMLIDELSSGAIQHDQVFSLAAVEMLRLGIEPEQVIINVVAVGLNSLGDRGYVDRINMVDEAGSPCTIIVPTPKFFEPIQRFVAVPA